MSSNSFLRQAQALVLILIFLCASTMAQAEVFRVATYNLNFYIDAPALGNEPKSQESRKAVRAAIRQINPDVIALQEVGSTNALLELGASLRAEGLDFPHWDHVDGLDNNLHLAFLSKHRILARAHHRDRFLLHGRRFEVARGFGQIEIEPVPGLRVTLLTAHLKSKRQTAEADQQEVREQEAILLRERIDELLKREARFIVLGDFNDGFSTATLKTIMGRGRGRLFDTRPAESGGGVAGQGRAGIVWTHYYVRDETYSRIDYILASPSLEKALRLPGTRVLAWPNWHTASDHRPICAEFEWPPARGNKPKAP